MFSAPPAPSPSGSSERTPWIGRGSPPTRWRRLALRCSRPPWWWPGGASWRFVTRDVKRTTAMSMAPCVAAGTWLEIMRRSPALTSCEVDPAATPRCRGDRQGPPPAGGDQVVVGRAQEDGRLGGWDGGQDDDGDQDLDGRVHHRVLGEQGEYLCSSISRIQIFTFRFFCRTSVSDKTGNCWQYGDRSKTIIYMNAWVNIHVSALLSRVTLLLIQSHPLFSKKIVCTWRPLHTVRLLIGTQHPTSLRSPNLSM